MRRSRNRFDRRSPNGLVRCSPNGLVRRSPNALDRRSPNGFTLLETVIMLAGLSVGFASLMWLSSEVGRRNLEAREVAAATLLAHNQMEMLLLEPRASLQDRGGVEGTAGPLDANGSSSPTGRYSLTWDIQQDVPEVGVRRLRVTVAWRSTDLKSREIALDTVVSHAVR